NPVKNWWGEGDEKITVDGEAFPSIFGTGTEDYFGYAWCCSEPFSHPYHAQPTCDGPGNYGLTTVNRFHLLDPIPFHRSVRFDMELWHWKDVKVDYATTVFFYAKAGARDRAPYPAGRTPHLQLPEPYVAPRVAGAIEAEALRFEVRSGTAVVQESTIEWSDERQLWWQDPEVGGGPLVVFFDAPAAGRFRVLGRFTLARDYGRHRLAVNDDPQVFEHDFYRRDLKLGDELELGVFTLTEKDNRLTVVCVGKHPDALDRRMFGLDYLKLVPVP
ncbi:MAG: DUF2961 domain-containing protein, partial [Planctomycetes bacterium]|nr:DUF2961 domain-containing protein [Planctomycetota bacterium]